MPATRSTLPLTALLVTAALAASAGEPIVGPRPQAVDDRWLLNPPGVKVETWVKGLAAPWSLAFLPDGRALVSERRGRILLIGRDRRPRTIFEFNILEDDESGLMGLAVHPGFPARPFIYAMYTWREGGRTGNAVFRFRLEGGRMSNDRLIVRDIPAGDNHNGGCSSSQAMVSACACSTDSRAR